MWGYSSACDPTGRGPDAARRAEDGGATIRDGLLHPPEPLLNPWCLIPISHSPTTFAELLAELDSLDRRADALVSDAGRVARLARKAVRAARAGPARRKRRATFR